MAFLKTSLVATAAFALLSVPAFAAPADDVADAPPPPAGPPQPAYEPLAADSSALIPSLETVADVDRFLAPTPLHGMGAEFIRAEARTGVNARFLVGITWVENNSGASYLAQTQHNLFSFKGDGPGGWLAYSSSEDSIRQSSDFIGKEYARPGGKFFHGGTLAAIGHVYAEDPNWATRVAKAANSIGPSAGPAYAGAIAIQGQEADKVTLAVTNEGYAAWDLAGAKSLLLHYRWSRGRASTTGDATLPAPALRSGGVTEVTLSTSPPDLGSWNLQVTAELAGDGWVTSLGGDAHASLRVNFGDDQASLCLTSRVRPAAR